MRIVQRQEIATDLARLERVRLSPQHETLTARGRRRRRQRPCVRQEIQDQEEIQDQDGVRWTFGEGLVSSLLM